METQTNAAAEGVEKTLNPNKKRTTNLDAKTLNTNKKLTTNLYINPHLKEPQTRNPSWERAKLSKLEAFKRT